MMSEESPAVATSKSSANSDESRAVQAPTPLVCLTEAIGEEFAQKALDAIELCARRVAHLKHPDRVITPVLAFPRPYGEFGAVLIKEPYTTEEARQNGKTTER